MLQRDKHGSAHSARHGPRQSRAFWLISLIIFTIVTLAPAVIAENFLFNFTPLEWKADTVGWNRDVNPYNKVDDLIDDSADPMFDIVVNFNRCVEEEDVEMLIDLSTDSVWRMNYLTSVIVNGVPRDNVNEIAGWPGVAFIEMQVPIVPHLDVSVEAIKVASGFYSPNTVADAFTVIDGDSVNIAILDSGVDDLQHEAFAGSFVAGYDAVTRTFGNPDDEYGHGTHVASIALGRATTNYPYRGVAPGAGLIDIKLVSCQFSNVG